MTLQRTGDTQSGTPLTIAPPAGGGGGGGSQNLFETVAGDSGSAVADTTTDTLTLAGGTGITTTGQSTPDKVTIDLDTPVAVANGGTNASSFALTDGITLYDGSKLATGTITHPSAGLLDEVAKLQSDGTDALFVLNAAGETIALFTGVGTLVNYASMFASATGVNVGVQAFGTDSAIAFSVVPKGDAATILGSSTSANGGLAVFQKEYDNGTKTGNFTIDWTKGNKQTVTINVATVTISFTDPPGAGHFTLRMVMGATPPTAITWPAGVKWPRGGTHPVPSASTNDEDIYTFYFTDTGAGTNYYGTHVPDMA